ncbi:GNAT family N-acetyltransferase [Kribbella sp. NPDC026611]|uniref:GNAT family N-acetyltransferase n=1 Tax=Kribbella sp. NPDC026611 TaxID=3154911 RepID=UPI0033CB36DC
MEDLGPVPWPPAPIKTERLVLRAAEARDRTTFIDLYSSPEVHTYLGGPQPREELERAIPAVPAQWPGSFVVELNGSMIGQILLRKATDHQRPAATGKTDLGYLFLPTAWGSGYAIEACTAALTWFDIVFSPQRTSSPHHPVRQPRLYPPGHQTRLHRTRTLPSLEHRTMASHPPTS